MTTPADPITKQCPNCAEQVQDAAIVCRYCGYDFVTKLPSPPLETKTNGFSIASLVLGIMFLWWLGSILAVIFGHIALNQIKKANGRQTGRGMAIAGLVLGYIAIAALVLVVAAVVLKAAIDDNFSGRNLGVVAWL